MAGKISIFVCVCVFLAVQNCSANVPAYSMVLISNSLEDVSRVLPPAKDLSNQLVPFMKDLSSNLNSLSNVIRNLTPSMLPYFGLTLPLLYSALADIFSMLLMYVGTLVSLLRSGSLAGQPLGLVKTLLDVVLDLLKGVEDKDGLLDGVKGALENVIGGL